MLCKTNQAMTCVLLVLAIAEARAQVHITGSTPDELPPAYERDVSTICRAPVIRSGAEVSLTSAVFKKLTTNLTLGTLPSGGITIYPSATPETATENIALAVVSSKTINAWTVPSPTERKGGIICVPIGMIRFLGDEPSELAAVIAHEMGHALDNSCRGQRHTVPEQRVCEKKADMVGFAILVGAGYTPYAMAGLFGRLEMFSGDTQSGLLARFSGLFSDHPITPDRIRQSHDLIVNYCANNPARCE